MVEMKLLFEIRFNCLLFFRNVHWAYVTFIIIKLVFISKVANSATFQNPFQIFFTFSSCHCAGVLVTVLPAAHWSPAGSAQAS